MATEHVMTFLNFLRRRRGRRRRRISLYESLNLILVSHLGRDDVVDEDELFVVLSDECENIDAC